MTPAAQVPPPETLLSTFRASPALQKFVRDESHKICIRAANGGGKTYHVIYALSRFVVDHAGVRCRVVAPTKNQLRDVSGRYLWHFLKPYVADGSYWKEGTGWNKFNTVVLANGSSIELKGYRDDADTFEGAHDLEICVLDEPPPLSVLEACRRAKRLWLSFTAVGANSHLVPDYRKEIEGGEESPVSGRTEHATGWVQYVVPMERENVPWMSPERYEAQVAKYKGTAEEPQRLHAAWSGVVLGRKFEGWHPRYVLGIDAFRKRLVREEAGKEIALWSTTRYGIDHGTGAGKQRQYLIFVVGSGREARYYITGEYVAGAGSTPVTNSAAMLTTLEEWLGPVDKEPYLGLRGLNAAFGDINSAGPAGAGDQLNALMDRSLQLQCDLPEMPFGRIQAPIKSHGYKDARESALAFAILERRVWVLDECEYAIRAFEGYMGAPKDPHKDSIDAICYAIQDLLLEASTGAGPRIRN